MQIDKMFFPIKTLGPGNRLGIWTVGCEKRCIGCSNPELQIWDENKERDLGELLREVDFSEIDGVTISGGEPFLQASELKKLVLRLRTEGIRDILVYSGFTQEELTAKGDPDVDAVLSNIAVLIDGTYIEEKTDDIPLRGSSNQNVIVLRSEFAKAYADYLLGEKAIDIIKLENGEVHFIGIPPKNYRELYEDYIQTVHFPKKI